MNQEKFVTDLVMRGILDSMNKDGFSASQLQKKMIEMWNEGVDKFMPDFAEEQKKAMLEAIKDQGLLTKRLIIATPDSKKDKDLGLQHKQFEGLLSIINNSMPVLMVGLPAVGKTFAAEKAAQALNLDFHAISIGQQTTKSDIMGFMSATGNYVTTPFRKAFEKGGIFLMDEIDAGNPNVLIQINSAISNGFVEFPDKMVRVHKDFRFIGTANTYGGGINSKFVGRNQLDAATLDRFCFIDWQIDESLEEALVQNEMLCKLIRTMRKVVQDEEMEVIITTRSAMFADKLLEIGYTVDEAISMAVFRGIPNDMRSHFNVCVDHFKKDLDNKPNALPAPSDGDGDDDSNVIIKDGKAELAKLCEKIVELNEMWGDAEEGDEENDIEERLEATYIKAKELKAQLKEVGCQRLMKIPKIISN